MNPAELDGQAPILTVTLNPALDLSTATDSVVPELKLRCDRPQCDPGGGGINVSRAVARMGGASTALIALGGSTGMRLAGLLHEAGMTVVDLPAPGETRQSLAVTDRSIGQQYRFVTPGPQWSDADVRAALIAIDDSAPADGIVVLSGSNPPGVPADFAVRLGAMLGAAGARLMVDTSGAALAAVAAGRNAGIEVLRMDAAEARELSGAALAERRDTADFAAGLVASGAARAVIVARGADGNVIATGDGRWHAEAAPVTVVSRIGAGDSFVAGFALATARGWDAPLALALGAAAASAACMTPATELCHAEDVDRLFAARVVTRI